MRKPFGKVKNRADRQLLRRKLSIRKKVAGTEQRPRISVYRSNANFSIQVINDDLGKTLFSVNTFGKKSALKDISPNKEGAKQVGAKVAESLKKAGIANAVLDRNGMKYGGVLAVLTESIRENGINI